MIPHPEIPISTLRPNDILLLLTLGILSESLTRLLSFVTKKRSSKEQSLHTELHGLRYETAIMRNKGPSAFVETSKLERVVLSKEKQLEKLEGERKVKMQKMDRFIRNAGIALNVLVFLVYYGVPLLVIDGMRVPSSSSSSFEVEEPDHLSDGERAAAFFKAWLFPISYIGIGRKISSIGLPDKAYSMGALIVFWSAQVFCKKVCECLEALSLR